MISYANKLKDYTIASSHLEILIIYKLISNIVKVKLYAILLLAMYKFTIHIPE